MRLLISFNLNATYQKRFYRRLEASGEHIVPVDVFEEWVYLNRRRILGSAAKALRFLPLHQATHQIPGFRCEVGWQIELGFQNGLDGLLAILGGEGWLIELSIKHKDYQTLVGFSLTTPVSMSNIRAPSDHQSTALPWPLLVKISGALQANQSHIKFKIRLLLRELK